VKPKILIMDDEKPILHALQVFLTQQSYRVTTVTEYNHLLEKTKANGLPDLLILDHMLKNENGAEIAKELKTNPKTKHIPIIMISAYPQANKMATTAGVDAFLAKPFDASVLLEMIKRLCKN
jgi:DNA-binding response OmpR family regulator